MKLAKQVSWAAIGLVIFLTASVGIFRLISMLQVGFAQIATPVAKIKNQPSTQELKTYQSIYRYKFTYPQRWLLNSDSPEEVTVHPSAENPYQTIIFEYVSAPVPLGRAIICDPPTSLFKAIQSGQKIHWVQQNSCFLSEERDRYGVGSLIEANVPLDDGHFLYVVGESTTKPADESANIRAVLYGLTLE